MAMKLMLLALLGLAWSGNAVQTVSKTRGPIQKVTDLLREMHDQLANDEKVEQMIYNKYACWCEKATAKKAQAIEDAQEQLRELSQSILTLKGEIATLKAQIAKLEQKLEENAKMQEEATAIRRKQNEEYMEFTAETKQALVALEKAIAVLIEGATKPLKEEEAAAFIQTQGRQVLKNVMQSLPASATLKADQMAFLSEFLSGESKAKYTPQSMTVQGVLKDMYETFALDVEDATMEEAKRNRDYEQVIADLIAEANNMKEEKAKKEETKAEKEVELADASEMYDQVQEQMEADIEFFDETKVACEAKHDEWETRSRLRTDEMNGIAQAIQILSDDDNRELFEKAIREGKEVNADTSKYNTGADISGSIPPTLLQIDSQAPALSAYRALKAQASSVKSLRLAALAARVHEAKAGHFDGVIKAIDDMLQTLTDEEAADIAKRDQCKEEITQSNATILQLKWEIKCNKAKIEKLQRKIDEKHAEIKKADEEIKDTYKFMNDTTDVRNQEHSDFLQDKKNDQDAIKLLVQVRDVLQTYYENNKITDSWGPIQGSVKGNVGMVLAQKMKKQDPAFARSEFEAPEATFSPIDKHSNEAKGVVQILTMVIEDLNDEIANDMKTEEERQLIYEKQMHAARMLIAKLKAKIVFLNDVISKLGKEKSDEIAVMNQNGVLLEDEEEYLAGILPDCQWVFKAFFERADKRAAETQGLTTAKAYLVGYDPKQEQVGYLAEQLPQGAALAQFPNKFDDDALARIHFGLRGQSGSHLRG